MTFTFYVLEKCDFLCCSENNNIPRYQEMCGMIKRIGRLTRQITKETKLIFCIK
jgi:hypothetical protein